MASHDYQAGEVLEKLAALQTQLKDDADGIELASRIVLVGNFQQTNNEKNTGSSFYVTTEIIKKYL